MAYSHGGIQTWEIEKLIIVKGKKLIKDIFMEFSKNVVPIKGMYEGKSSAKRIKVLKYYSPTVTHDKTFVYDFCVLCIT